MDEGFDLGYTPVATTAQKTALTRHTKFNESRFCSLRSCETPNVNKKHISFNMNAAAEFHPPVAKNEVLTVSKASLIRGSTTLIELAFSFYFDKSRKSLQRWVVGMRIKAEITFWLGFRCSGMLITDNQKSAKTATFASLKSLKLLHFYRTWF